MSSSRRARSRPMSQINVVPYIDVMLVLLVIFMVTAPMINTGVVDLPSISKSSAVPSKPIEIIVSDDRRVVQLRDGTTASAQIVNMDLLAQKVRELQQQSPGRAVVIAASPSVNYGRVMQVMDLLQRADIEKIGLLTRPRSN